MCFYNSEIWVEKKQLRWNHGPIFSGKVGVIFYTLIKLNILMSNIPRPVHCTVSTGKLINVLFRCIIQIYGYGEKQILYRCPDIRTDTRIDTSEVTLCQDPRVRGGEVANAGPAPRSYLFKSLFVSTVFARSSLHHSQQTNIKDIQDNLLVPFQLKGRNLSGPELKPPFSEAQRDEVSFFCIFSTWAVGFIQKMVSLWFTVEQNQPFSLLRLDVEGDVGGEVGVHQGSTPPVWQWSLLVDLRIWMNECWKSNLSHLSNSI